MPAHDTIPTLPSKGAATPQASRHLVVLQHGLWGQAVNMAFLEQLLQERAQMLEGQTVVVKSEVNEKYHTYEGIDACGERLADLIVDKLNEAAAEGEPFTHLSLVGYSMGGLMTRYAAGKLHALGLLACTPASRHGKRTADSAGTPGSNGAANAAASTAEASRNIKGSNDTSSTDKEQPAPPPVQPVNFVTIATPHLGSWVLPTSFWQRLFNTLVPQMAARSGTQLMLLDTHALNRPLLINMADPDLPFMQGVASFPHKTLLANTMHDRSVPYCTAAISETNPYESHAGVPIDPKYPSIVHPVPKPKQQASLCKSKASDKSAPTSPQPSPSTGPTSPQTRSLHQSAAPPQQATPLFGEEVDAPRQASLLSDKQVQAAIMSASSAEAAEDDHQSLDPDQVVDASMPASAKSEGFTSRKGWGVRLAVLGLLPLSLPLGIGMLSYMVMVGRRQWTAILGRTFDHSWVEKYHDSKAASTANSSGTATDADADAGLQSQPSTSLPSHNRMTQLTGRAMQVPEAELHSLSVRQSQELTDEDVDVSIDDGAKSFHVHQGLVDTPGSRERHFQQWMLKNLNMLKWKKVDVDTRHYHAHAAIMMRSPKKFKDNADCLRYLVDSMVLQGLTMSA